MIKIMMLVAALALPAPAVGSKPGDTKDDAGQEMVCKRISNTGWRLSAGRVCKTRQDWDRRAEEAQKDHEDFGSDMGRRRCLGCDD